MRCPRKRGRLSSVWTVQESRDIDLIIGDSGAVARGKDGTTGYFMRFGKEHWSEVYLPVSGHQVLVAHRDESGSLMGAADLNNASARQSVLCFWSSVASIELRELGKVIGAGDPLASDLEIEDMVREYWRTEERKRNE
jgi:hypothetical protein